MQPTKRSLARVLVSALAVGAFLGPGSLTSNADRRDNDSFIGAHRKESDNFVYVMSNKASHNSVIQYQRAENGALVWGQEVLTGGRGTGATAVDPLGSQDSLVLSGDGHLLLAANAGSNEITVFEVDHDKLTWRNKVRSGGQFPNSIALFGDLVYVLNAKGTSPNITGFRLDPDGFLHAIPGARVALPPGSMGANDVQFAQDGTKLLVTVSGTNQVLVFGVGDDGIAGSANAQTSLGVGPFGIRFGRNGTVLVSEAGGSASSYSFGPNDTLDMISGGVSDTQKAACWISLNRSATYAYVSNTGSGTISSYQIGASGDLTLAKAIAANTGGAPIDSALSRDSKFLYVLDSAQGRVVALKVDGSTLVKVGAVSLPTSIQGIAAQ